MLISKHDFFDERPSKDRWRMRLALAFIFLAGFVGFFIAAATLFFLLVGLSTGGAQ